MPLVFRLTKISQHLVQSAMAAVGSSSHSAQSAAAVTATMAIIGRKQRIERMAIYPINVEIDKILQPKEIWRNRAEQDYLMFV